MDNIYEIWKTAYHASNQTDIRTVRKAIESLQNLDVREIASFEERYYKENQNVSHPNHNL